MYICNICFSLHHVLKCSKCHINCEFIYLIFLSVNVVSAISQILKREFVLEVVCRFEKYSFAGLID